MKLKSERLFEIREGQKKIQILKENKSKTLVIHYSCESFFNLEGRTPRITSICVKNRDSGETKAFSIHLQAQFHKIDLEIATNENIDKLEKEMLSEFVKFVEKHKSYYWVHWNMRNASYGFEAISNRSRIVGGKTLSIEDDKKYDLVDIMGKLYTYKFVEDKPNGKLFNISLLNKISIRDAMNGKAEAEAFENKKYLLLHMSTMRKVEMIDRVLYLCETDKIKHNVKSKDIYGLSVNGVIEIVKNNPILIGIWSVFIYILGAATEPIIQALFGTAK